MFLASNIDQVTVISGWNDSYGSMRPKGHVRHLVAVIGGIPDAQCVQNSRWRGIIFGLENPMSEGGAMARSWPPMPHKWL